jgi:hypothetical protein
MQMQQPNYPPPQAPVIETPKIKEEPVMSSARGVIWQGGGNK